MSWRVIFLEKENKSFSIFILRRSGEQFVDFLCVLAIDEVRLTGMQCKTWRNGIRIDMKRFLKQFGVSFQTRWSYQDEKQMSGNYELQGN